MNLLEDLKSRVIVSSGPIGTELQKRGYSLTENTAVWALEHPYEFKDMLKSHADHGAELLYATNSSANRLRLHGLGLHVEAFRIARDWARACYEPPVRSGAA